VSAKAVDAHQFCQPSLAKTCPLPDRAQSLAELRSELKTTFASHWDSPADRI